MATVIDALVVTLGLNAQGFLQGNREANQSLDRTRTNTRTLTAEEEKREKLNKKNRTDRDRDHVKQKTQQKENIDAYRELTKQAVSFFGVATTFGGMASWIGGITQANSQLYRTSNNLDTGVESLKEWGMAIEQTGGDAKSAVSTMQMLSKMMTEIKYGILPANMGLFNALGVDLFKAAQSGEPLVEVLKMINKGAQGIKEKNGIRDAINSIQMLGVDYDMANLLVKDEKALNAFLASADKINKLNQSGAENSAKLSQQWVILKQKGEALGQTIEEKVTPRIFDFIKGLEKLVEENPKAVAAVGILAGAFLVKFSPVRAVLAGIAGLLVADDWVTWANKGESQIGRLIAAAKQFWYTFNGAFDEKSKLDLDVSFAQKLKKGLETVGAVNDAVLLGVDTPQSKIGKGQGDVGVRKTGKGEKEQLNRYKFTKKELIGDLIKKGYSFKEVQEQANFYEKEAGLDNRGRINSQINIASKLNQDARQLAAQPQVGGGNSTSTNTNSTSVGQVIINTQASDARGVYNEFVNRVLVNQAESGGF